MIKQIELDFDGTTILSTETGIEGLINTAKKIGLTPPSPFFLGENWGAQLEELVDMVEKEYQWPAGAATKLCQAFDVFCFSEPRHSLPENVHGVLSYLASRYML
ncbi:MAG: hypothetical protein NUV82_01260, partial [Candidatus Komeilibacteria bacterium]|nr:hypothetical protein [Candidatus Komeilibacteria bacterium]